MGETPAVTHKPRDEVPDAAALNTLRTRLNIRHGLSAAAVASLTDGMTRAEIVARLVEICKALPAATKAGEV